MAQDAEAKESSSHRLPTLSAAEALQELEENKATPIALGSARLDALLQGRYADAESRAFEGRDGLPRGQVTEVYGPPGVGKTTLCIQAAASALHSGYKVVWIDTATALAGRRLVQVLSGQLRSGEEDEHEKPTAGRTRDDLLTRFSHYVAPTLAHLLALVSHAPSTFPPHEAALLVVDSLSTSIDNAYPRHAENRARSSKNDQAKWLTDRRQAVISEVGSKLATMAAARNIAVLVTNNTVTKVRVGAEAQLRPSIAGQEWENAIGGRVVLFRDWVSDKGASGRLRGKDSARFAELVKSSSDARSGFARNVVAFEIYESGIREMMEVTAPAQISPVEAKFTSSARKRHRDEIADSEAEDSSSDYGWHDADDQLAAEGLVDASFV